jgi:hypothetical protein
MAQIYISYSHSDDEAAQHIIESVRQAGYSTFDDRGMRTGSEWEDAKTAAIDAAQCVVIIWSKGAADSAFLQYEIQRAIKAWSLDRLVLAALDDTPLPVGLRDLSPIHIRNGDDAGTQKVVERIKRSLEFAGPATPVVLNRPHRFWLIAAIGLCLFLIPFGWLNRSRIASETDAETIAVEAAKARHRADVADQARQAALDGADKADKARQAAEAKAADAEKARQAAEAKAADGIPNEVETTALARVRIDEADKARQAAADAERARKGAEEVAANAVRARQAAERLAADAEKARQSALWSRHLLFQVLESAIVGGVIGAAAVGAIWMLLRRRQRLAAIQPSVTILVNAPKTPSSTPQVFVSYSHEDERAVDALVRQIEELGHAIWIDRESTGSQRYAGKIVEAIKASRFVALMGSQSAFASDHVMREVYIAGDLKKPFIVFLLDPAELPNDILYFVSGFPRVAVTSMDIQRLRSEIARVVGA